LEIARETEDVYESIIPRGAEAMLLVELQGDDVESTRRRLNKTLYRIEKKTGCVVSYRITTDNAQRNLLWRLARRFIPRLYRLKGNQRPLPFVEDISVPPSKLPEFLRVAQDLLKQHRVTATLFAHALHGQVDIRPFFDLASPKDQVRLAQLGEDIYAKVIEFGGCVSGEQAFGLSRAAWAERQLGQRLELCRKIKQLFDPAGIMNPGKFLSPSPPRPNENLRPVPRFEQQTPSAATGYRVDEIAGGNPPPSHLKTLGERAATAPNTPGPTASGNISSDSSEKAHVKIELPVLLDWKEDALGYAARSCNGCGRCRTSASTERMCPVFRVHKGEESSPRAKANLLRGFLTGSLDATDVESRELKEISDLCFNCHQCRIDCPASVDIPKLVLEAKGQHIAAHGLPLQKRLLNRLDVLASWGSRAPRLANWALASPMMRWCLEKGFGIAAGRKLPGVSRFSFLWWANRNRLTVRPKPAQTTASEDAEPSGTAPQQGSAKHKTKVCYFVDQYVNQHNPMLGRAVVHVLKHQGIEVFVPPNQTPSWMAMIAAGDIARARKLIQTNIKVLADAVRQGYTIVTSEPSAALCLTREYPSLVDNEDTRLIAENTLEVSSFLWNLHNKRELKKDFSPVQFSVVYHQPCHARALDDRNPALQLLKLIPGLEIDSAGNGCSGMAGTFGLERRNFITSVRIGIKLINKMKYTRSTMGSTECTACKLQMEQGTTKATIHPVAIMAYAYGDMPQIEKWFHRTSADYIAS
jgi:Fe-S oxidoreductase